LALLYITKKEMTGYLKLINTELKRLGMRGEILIAGGASMCLAFSARDATKDIDAIYEPKNVINEIAARIAEKKNLPKSWLNDSVKGFMNKNALKNKILINDFSNLMIFTVMPDYLLAMKLISSRMDTDVDKKDIIFLMKHLRIDTMEKALKILDDTFPAGLILPKTKYMIEEGLDEMEKPHD